MLGKVINRSYIESQSAYVYTLRSMGDAIYTLSSKLDIKLNHTVVFTKYNIVKEVDLFDLLNNYRKMTNAAGIYKTQIIEVDAIAPLSRGYYPVSEYLHRLDKCVELFTGNETIYVIGKLCVGDKISLAEAGKEYLLTKGIPEDSIKTIDSGIFTNDDGSRIICNNNPNTGVSVICSSVQSFRKYFLYVENGIVPNIVNTDLHVGPHAYAIEFFGELLNLIVNDSMYVEIKNRITYDDFNNEEL